MRRRALRLSLRSPRPERAAAPSGQVSRCPMTCCLSSLPSLGWSREPPLDFVEKVADRLDAREALVRYLDAQATLERADDLQDAERVDRQLADGHRLHHVVEILLDDFGRRLAKHREQFGARRSGVT